MRAALIPLALALSACGQTERSADICTPAASFEERMGASMVPPTADYQTRVGAAYIVADFCVMQESRRLARSPDDADDVARSVVERCRDEIHAIERAESPPASFHSERQAYLRERYRDKALALTVEARAGDCQPIP